MARLELTESQPPVIFNSLQYLAFFPIVLALFFALPTKLRLPWLVLASLYFHGWSAWGSLLLLIAASLFAFIMALAIDRAADKEAKGRLTRSTVIVLVLNLFTFKYTGFLNESIRSVVDAWGGRYPVPIVSLILPLGISFYTFQLISYVVDVSRGEKPERDPWVFGTFVTFFPKLVSGPIERSKHLLPQLRKGTSLTLVNLVAGGELMVWGFFKKVVVADRLAPFVAKVYDDPYGFDGVSIAFATWLFAFQVYCDFSGYTDVARGTARLFGYQLTENFNRPYSAQTVSDFWKRWHISLTSWLTDYVYTPLTRQKRFKIKLYNLILISLFITFVASGFWHGAEWTFVLWGALHGAYLVISMMTQKWRAQTAKRFKLERFPRAHRTYKVMATFSMVCFAYIFFQARNLSEAWYMISHLPTGWSHLPASVKAVTGSLWVELGFGLGSALFVLWAESLGAKGTLQDRLAPLPPWKRFGFYQLCAVAILLLGAFYEQNQAFIYFQF